MIAALSILLAYTFAWSAQDTVSRFYLRESLASFLSALIALYAMFTLREIHKEANAGRILMLLIGLYFFESLLYSFSSILSIGIRTELPDYPLALLGFILPILAIKLSFVIGRSKSPFKDLKEI